MTRDDMVKFLNEAASYFEKRPTGGEDMAFWANVNNAENCRKIATALETIACVEQRGEAVAWRYWRPAFRDGVWSFLTREDFERVGGVAGAEPLYLAAPPPPVAVTVKPLEWEVEALSRRQKEPKFWYAETAIGGYTIEKKNKFWLGRPIPDSAKNVYYDTLEAAKAAAQADYEQRIGSALVETPAPVAAVDRAALIEMVGRAICQEKIGNPDWPIGINKDGNAFEPHVSTIPAWKWHYGRAAELAVDAMIAARPAAPAPAEAEDDDAIGRDFLTALEAAQAAHPWLADWAPAESYGELIGDLCDMVEAAAGAAEREADLTRPIIGIELRSAQEAFDIMVDRIRSAIRARTTKPSAEVER